MLEFGMAILFILTYHVGNADGVEYQKYYDRLMREKVVDRVYQEGYEQGLKKAEFDRQIRMIELGIDYTIGGNKNG